VFRANNNRSTLPAVINFPLFRKPMTLSASIKMEHLFFERSFANCYTIVDFTFTQLEVLQKK
jgi:hypothetical protein